MPGKQKEDLSLRRRLARSAAESSKRFLFSYWDPTAHRLLLTYREHESCFS